MENIVAPNQPLSGFGSSMCNDTTAEKRSVTDMFSMRQARRLDPTRHNMRSNQGLATHDANISTPLSTDL
jgi:hypothetical protein